MYEDIIKKIEKMINDRKEAMSSDFHYQPYYYRPDVFLENIYGLTGGVIDENYIFPPSSNNEGLIDLIAIVIETYKKEEGVKSVWGDPNYVLVMLRKHLRSCLRKDIGRVKSGQVEL